MMDEQMLPLDDDALDALLNEMPLAPLPPGFGARTINRLAPRMPPRRLRLLDLALPIGAGLVAVVGWLFFLWFTGRFGATPAELAASPLLSLFSAGGGAWLLLSAVAVVLLLLIAVALAVEEQTYQVVPPRS